MKWNERQAREEWNRARARLLQDSLYRGQRQAAMEWLLKFAQRPLDQLSHGDQFNVALELFHFCRDTGRADDAHDSLDLGWIDENLEEFTDRWPALQRLAIKYLDLFLQNDPQAPAIFPVKVTLMARPGQAHPQVQAEVTQSAFLYQLAHLLCEHGDRIRRCRGCERYFLAGRSDKTWCSGRCQALVYKREHPPNKSKRKVQKRVEKRRSKHGTKR